MSEPIKSPCINICQIHPATNLCVGCYRTLDEIAKWRFYTSQERDEIINLLPNREKAHYAQNARPSKQRDERKKK